MGLKLITPPANPVLSLAEAKAHLRVSYTDDDTLIAALVEAATKYAEEFTGRAFIDQTWDLYLDAFPTGWNLEIKIPKPPLIEVLSVSYDQTDGTEATVDTGDYYVDTITQPGWVVPQGTLEWPVPIDAINSVRIRFRAGYLSTDSPPVDAVPDDIKAALKLTLGALYEHREQVTLVAANIIPWGADQLFRQHRIVRSMA